MTQAEGAPSDQSHAGTFDRRQEHPDVEWRAHIDQRITAIDGRLAEGAEQMRANTAMTEETRDQLRKFMARADPSLEVTEQMLRGAAAIGRFGAFVDRWGRRIVRVVAWGLGIYLAGKVLLSGGGWAEAMRAFTEVQK